RGLRRRCGRRVLALDREGHGLRLRRILIFDGDGYAFGRFEDVALDLDAEVREQARREFKTASELRHGVFVWRVAADGQVATLLFDGGEPEVFELRQAFVDRREHRDRPLLRVAQVFDRLDARLHLLRLLL